MGPFQGLEQAIEQIEGQGLGFPRLLRIAGMGGTVGGGQQHPEDTVGIIGGKRVLLS